MAFSSFLVNYSVRSEGKERWRETAEGQGGGRKTQKGRDKGRDESESTVEVEREGES